MFLMPGSKTLVFQFQLNPRIYETFPTETLLKKMKQEVSEQYQFEYRDNSMKMALLKFSHNQDSEASNNIHNCRSNKAIQTGRFEFRLRWKELGLKLCRKKGFNLEKTKIKSIFRTIRILLQG